MAAKPSINAHPPLRNMISPAEGAAFYGVSLRTFRRLISDGEISAYRLPGSRLIRVDVAELDAKLQRIPTAGGAA